MKRTNSNDLPQDIFIKILHLLPFATILQCKRVSKEWKSLINDPKFYNLYGNKCLTLFISKGSLYCSLIRHAGRLNMTRITSKVHRIPIEFKDGSARELVSEPLKTVVCVRSANNHLLFYNLLTGASSTVVLDAPIVNLPQVPTWFCYGFGYDHYADDYKIVVVSNYHNHKKGNGQFSVYSIRNHAWMTLQGFPYGDYVRVRDDRACSFNGVLHWVFPKRGEDQEELIVTYDLHTCKFGELQKVPVRENITGYSLMELDGQLCHLIRNDYGVRVWVKKESWTKLFSLDESNVDTHGVVLSMSQKFVLFVCSNNTRLIWHCIEHGSSRLVQYDESWKVIAVSGYIDISCWECIDFMVD